MASSSERPISNTPATLNCRSRGVGHAARGDGRNEQGHGIAGREAELLGDHLTDDDVVGAGSQISQLACGDRPDQLRDGGLGLGIDAPQLHGQHLRGAHGERLDLGVGGDTDDTGGAGHGLGSQLPLFGTWGRGTLSLCRHHTRIGIQRKESLSEIALEAVHHGENDDERGDAHADAGQGGPGDEGNEELVGPGADVAQPHEERQRMEHPDYLTISGRLTAES